MKRTLYALLWMWSLTACRNETAGKEIASEDDTVSGAEMPAGQPLALDSTRNMRVVEHGLQFEAGYYYGSGGYRYVPSSHRYYMADTTFFNPLITGYGASDGKVSVSLSEMLIRDAGGKVILDQRGSKHVSRFPENTASFATFYMPIAWLDSLAGSQSAPHYDIKYTLKDRISGKGIEGLYRIHVQR